MLTSNADTTHTPGFGEGYLSECRSLVLEEIRTIVREGTSGDPRAYEMLLDYPLRRAKALRPAICIAVCRALGGELHDVLPSAAVIELFHNAFLIHDDVEDGSLRRRGGPALHLVHGVPQAVNCGDGMLALTLGPLLRNTEHLGLGRALFVLERYATMVTESFEGQSHELRWISDGVWDLTDQDYESMVVKKTCNYSFVTPALVGAAIARATPEVEAQLEGFLQRLGLAFQIQDDLLNLESGRGGYGKEFAGDLWEGKRTLMLLHALRTASPFDRAHARAVLGRARPSSDGATARLAAALDRLVERGALDRRARPDVEQELAASLAGGATKTEEDVAFLLALIDACGGVEHARAVARRHAAGADAAWEALAPRLRAGADRRFLEWLKDFVIRREW